MTLFEAHQVQYRGASCQGLHLELRAVGIDEPRPGGAKAGAPPSALKVIVSTSLRSMVTLATLQKKMARSPLAEMLMSSLEGPEDFRCARPDSSPGNEPSSGPPLITRCAEAGCEGRAESGPHRKETDQWDKNVPISPRNFGHAGSSGIGTWFSESNVTNCAFGIDVAIRRPSSKGTRLS